MAGLDPAIHLLRDGSSGDRWIRGSSPHMTTVNAEPPIHRVYRWPSPRPEFLSEFKNLPRARHIRPGAVEVGDQRLHGFAVHGAIERGAVGEFIGRLMNGRIAQAPEPPRLVDPERLHRIRQMLLTIPVIEGGAAGRIGDGGADDEVGRRHWRTPRANCFKSSRRAP